MKKILISFLIILIFLIYNPEKIRPTIKTIDDTSEYQIYDIEIPELNTKNFKKYFNEEDKILKIYPKINPIYKNKIGKIYYNYQNNSIENNLTKIKNQYIDLLKQNGFTNDINKIYINGLYIDKIQIYTNKQTIEKLKTNSKKITYKKIQK